MHRPIAAVSVVSLSLGLACEASASITIPTVPIAAALLGLGGLLATRRGAPIGLIAPR